MLSRISPHQHRPTAFQRKRCFQRRPGNLRSADSSATGLATAAGRTATVAQLLADRKIDPTIRVDYGGDIQNCAGRAVGNFIAQVGASSSGAVVIDLGRWDRNIPTDIDVGLLAALDQDTGSGEYPDSLIVRHCLDGCGIASGGVDDVVEASFPGAALASGRGRAIETAVEHLPLHAQLLGVAETYAGHRHLDQYLAGRLVHFPEQALHLLPGTRRSSEQDGVSILVLHYGAAAADTGRQATEQTVSTVAPTNAAAPAACSKGATAGAAPSSPARLPPPDRLEALLCSPEVIP